MTKISTASAQSFFEITNDEKTKSVQEKTAPTTVQMVSDEALSNEDLSQSKEPQFVKEYGKTKLPEGSVLKDERIQYANILDQATGNFVQYKVQVGVIELPNGVVVTLVTNPSDDKKGSISIEKDGTVTFDHVAYTDINGTDNDDKFNFKNPYNDGLYRNIRTGKGNDTVINPTSVPASTEIPHWPDMYGRTEINADENLSVQGNAESVHIRAQGNIDLTKSWGNTPDIQGSVNIKK